MEAAQRDGFLPPEMRPQDLSGELQKPSVDELKRVMDLHHLARCVEARYRQRPILRLAEYYEEAAAEYPPGEAREVAARSRPEDIGSIEVWRERFDTTLYMSLILGAALTRAYRQPFIDDEPMPGTNEAKQTRRSILEKVNAMSGGSSPLLSLDAAELEYLQSYPVYRLDIDFKTHDTVFSSLADWFMSTVLEDDRARPPISPPAPTPRINASLFNVAGPTSWPESSPLSDRFARGSCKEESRVIFSTIIRTIHAYCFLHSCLARVPDPDEDELPPAGLTRSAKIVLLGVFHAQEVFMPPNASDSIESSLQRRGASSPLPYLNLGDIINPLYSHQYNLSLDSENIKRSSGGKVRILVYPPMHFFAYILEKEFGVVLVEHDWRVGNCWAPL